MLDSQYIECLCACGLYIIIHINKHLSLLNLDSVYDGETCLGVGCIIFSCVNCLAIIAVLALNIGIPLGCTFQSDDITCEGTFCYGLPKTVHNNENYQFYNIFPIESTQIRLDMYTYLVILYLLQA